MSTLFNPQNAAQRLIESASFLVVDDFETMRKITVNQLQQLGAQKIVTAKDGQEALRLIRSQRVDIVLSDWNMPVMTGLELLKTLRADPRTASMPFLMVTAEAERPRIEAAIQAGVSSMLIKPYSPNQLAARLEKALTTRAPRPSAPPAEPASASALGPAAVAVPDTANKAKTLPTILCVDDTPDNLSLLAGLLREDYRVQSAKDGEKALQICYSDKPPDLVLLDIMMPGMDGFEVARRMRQHPNSETIPVIFVTAMDTAEALQKGLDLGAVDFITKPIDPVMLKSRVRNFMRYVEMRRNLQAEYDGMMEVSQLREDVEHITRHDLKGPLAGILGLAQGLIQGGGLDGDKLEQLRLLEETALHTLDMVNRSSELFKIETGRFVLEPKPVPIADILHRTLELARTTYSEKQLQLSMTPEAASGTGAPKALGDAMLCYSLFQNLIKNACEAAPVNGRVSIRVLERVPLAVVIENDGAVPVEIRDRFFEKFSTSGKTGGTGLGTYSAQLLAQAQGGSIVLAVSDADNTTTITVSLPADKALAA
jgi:CheY-like chemotaxis protein